MGYCWLLINHHHQLYFRMKLLFGLSYFGHICQYQFKKSSNGVRSFFPRFFVFESHQTNHNAMKISIINYVKVKVYSTFVFGFSYVFAVQWNSFSYCKLCLYSKLSIPVEENFSAKFSAVDCISFNSSSSSNVFLLFASEKCLYSSFTVAWVSSSDKLKRLERRWQIANL